MTELNLEQIRNFRLHSHHLDAFYTKEDLIAAAGACGMQNSPPGAWETALYNRIPSCSQEDMNLFLYQERCLLQAWSLRGAPVVFPEEESDVFLSALIPQEDEPWIYTQGISLALDFLQMSFEELLPMLKQVMPRLNGKTIVTKSALDQTLAEWMLPLLPEEKKTLWNHPSMYGSPDKQTVGGAVVSFLLRPCAFDGLVVFGAREGISPTFTSYNAWTGHPLGNQGEGEKKLVRKFLHCYGPATPASFEGWLGCSGKQARRMWKAVSEEMEPVKAAGKKAWILSEDKACLLSPKPLQRELLLLGGHDPYLDQRDRSILQPDKSLHKQIWKMVANPGTVVYRGEIIGIWTSTKKSRGMEMKITLWNGFQDKEKISVLAEEYAAFRQQKLIGIEF